MKDLDEIPKNILKELEIISVKSIDEVLTHALLEVPKPVNADSKAEIEEISSKTAENKGEDVIRH